MVHPHKSILINEGGPTIPSEEMEEELLDYEEDYEPTEREKAEMEQYEKELEAQEAQQQKAEMELLEKQIEERAMKLSDVMNFSMGATSNMNLGSEVTVTGEDLEDALAKDQPDLKIEGDTDWTVKVQPAVALKRSQRLANRDDQGLSIQEQATKLKALQNEITSKPRLTVFNS